MGEGGGAYTVVNDFYSAREIWLWNFLPDAYRLIRRPGFLEQAWVEIFGEENDVTSRRGNWNDYVDAGILWKSRGNRLRLDFTTPQGFY